MDLEEHLFEAVHPTRQNGGDATITNRPYRESQRGQT